MASVAQEPMLLPQLCHTAPLNKKGTEVLSPHATKGAKRPQMPVMLDATGCVEMWTQGPQSPGFHSWDFHLSWGPDPANTPLNQLSGSKQIVPEARLEFAL